MTWFSIRRMCSLGVVALVVLLADHVQARADERSVRLQPDGQNGYANGQIAGRVLDGKARPLPDHRVELRIRIFSGGLRAAQTVATTMTDANGRFAFNGLAPGVFEVVVLRNDKTMTSAPIQLSPGAMNHTVTLGESAGVSYSFADLRAQVTPGERVRVTDISGIVTTGTVEDVSRSSLALLVDGVRRELPETQVRQITRRHGTWAGRGALIGAGVGAGAGLGFVGLAGGCHQDPECSAIMLAAVLTTTAVGTGAGAAIGWSLRKSEIIFLSPVLPESARLTVSPIASKEQRGLAVSLSF